MRNLIVLSALLIALSTSAKATDYIWSEATPTEIHIIPNGLVLIGDFNNSGVTCATGPKAIYLPKTDSNFDAKLSLALTAKASGKKIRVLIGPPLATNCYQVSALGHLPTVNPNYWQLKN